MNLNKVIIGLVDYNLNSFFKECNNEFEYQEAKDLVTNREENSHSGQAKHGKFQIDWLGIFGKHATTQKQGQVKTNTILLSQ